MPGISASKEYYENERKPTVFVEPHEWITCFQELFSINNDRMLVDLYQMQTLGPLYITELDSDFTKAEVKEFIPSMKNNKALILTLENSMLYCSPV
jgi:hypothetical protein